MFFKLSGKTINGCLIFIVLLYYYEYIIDYFENVIGEGGFGEVYRTIKNNQKYAIKVVLYINEDEDQKKHVDKEEGILKLLKNSCPYIVNFFESFQNNDYVFIYFYFFYFLLFFFKRGIKFLVMELCEVGTLKDLIDSRKRFKLLISEEQIWKIITQLFIGLAVMNSHNIAHRDIKDCNIFIDNENNVKIGIFFLFHFYFL
jgi:serine/threonine protein kinase